MHILSSVKLHYKTPVANNRNEKSSTPQRRCSGFYWSFVPVTNHLLLDIVTCLADFGNDWYHTIYTIEIYTTHLHIKKTILEKTTPSLAKWFSGVTFSIISPFSFTELILYIWQLQMLGPVIHTLLLDLMSIQLQFTLGSFTLWYCFLDVQNQYASAI
jgi:hypothetical protein